MENETKADENVILSSIKKIPAQDAVMKTSEWMWTILILSIPLIGLVMLFVWAFGGEENENKANFAKAYLLWYLIGGLALLLLFILFFSAITSMIF